MTSEHRPDCYYRQVGEHTYEPTEHVQGAWLPDEQHMAPVAGLLCHAMETELARPDLQLSRLSYEILGVMPRATTHVAVEVVRPGRTIELVAATMTAGGRPVVQARGWRLSRQDTTAVAAGLPDPLPAPDTLPVWDGMSQWTGGYIDTLEFRVEPGGEPGRRRVWCRSRVGLLDRPVSALARFVSLVDTANGIAARVDPKVWMFPNTDLQIHLWRTPDPVGGWVGLDTTATIGPDGVGLTHTVLHDRVGPVGRAAQILTVRPLPPR